MSQEPSENGSYQIARGLKVLQKLPSQSATFINVLLCDSYRCTMSLHLCLFPGPRLLSTAMARVVDRPGTQKHDAKTHPWVSKNNSSPSSPFHGRYFQPVTRKTHLPETHSAACFVCLTLHDRHRSVTGLPCQLSAFCSNVML